MRQRLGLKQGDQISFELENGTTVLRPYRSETNPFEAFAGALGAFDTKDEVNAWVADLRDE